MSILFWVVMFCFYGLPVLAGIMGVYAGCKCSLDSKRTMWIAPVIVGLISGWLAIEDFRKVLGHGPPIVGAIFGSVAVFCILFLIIYYGRSLK